MTTFVLNKVQDFIKADETTRPVLLQRYSYGLANRILAIFLGLPLVGLMYLLKPWITVRIGCLEFQRLGHLGANTESWLRNQALAPRDTKEFHVFISGTPLANKQLLTLIKRRVFVLDGNFFVCLYEGLRRIVSKNHWMWIDLSKSGWNQWELWKKDGITPQLSFTPQEIEQGQKVLEKMGVKEAAYICFYVRDDKFLDTFYKNNALNWKAHNYRDGDIQCCVEALNTIVYPSLKAVRMGAVVAKPLETSNPNIIDYASKYRTDFADVYLMAHCKFCLGDTAGIYVLANLFNRPVAMFNMIPFGCSTRSNQDIFIPKKQWSIKEERFLTFREIVDKETDKDDEYKAYSTEFYEKEGIRLVENSSEEILALAQEMNARIDGTWVAQEKDEQLQERYRKLFPSGHRMSGFQSRVGAQFLRENETLLK